jgi:hypothetical protein
MGLINPRPRASGLVCPRRGAFHPGAEERAAETLLASRRIKPRLRHEDWVFQQPPQPHPECCAKSSSHTRPAKLIFTHIFGSTQGMAVVRGGSAVSRESCGTRSATEPASPMLLPISVSPRGSPWRSKGE